ncbi:MAG: pyrroline-5-carboxylate reductase dimerization domain-containing protein [Patescibacteria group bacterium]
MNNKIAIIGMGHVGKALKQGLLSSGWKQKQLLTSNSAAENKKIAEQADWIILAVKPNKIAEVVKQIALKKEKVLFSVAIAVTTSHLKKLTTGEQKIIRMMPNLSIAYRQGVIGCFFREEISQTEKKKIQHFLQRLGKVIEVSEEKDLDAFSVLVGSGPAVVAYCIEMCIQAGQNLNLSKKTAQQIALQTFAGTVLYLQKTKQSAVELQAAVATKGGITEEIITMLDQQKVSDRFMQSLLRGYDKIKEMRI